MPPFGWLTTVNVTLRLGREDSFNPPAAVWKEQSCAFPFHHRLANGTLQVILQLQFKFFTSFVFSRMWTDEWIESGVQWTGVCTLNIKYCWPAGREGQCLPATSYASPRQTFPERGGKEQEDEEWMWCSIAQSPGALGLLGGACARWSQRHGQCTGRVPIYKLALFWAYKGILALPMQMPMLAGTRWVLCPQCVQHCQPLLSPFVNDLSLFRPLCTTLAFATAPCLALHYSVLVD